LEKNLTEALEPLKLLESIKAILFTRSNKKNGWLHAIRFYWKETAGDSLHPLPA
jgi:hypothetical protein